MYISSRAIIYCGAKLPGEFIFPATKYPPASTNPSIPAKAGISFSRQRECSAKRNIAMFAFGECGFAAEIPAFAGMEGCVELAAAFSFISPTPIPAKAGISLPSNCKKTMRCERCSPQQTGRFPPSREWKGGGRKPESHSRNSENFPRSGTLQCSPSANAASPQRFRLSPEWKGVLSWRPLFLLFPLLPFPRRRESPYHLIVKKRCGASVARPSKRGDSRLRGNGKGGAKAGISFSQQREFSAKRNIAMFAFGECGFAAEIPAFAGMEVGEALLFFGAFPCKRK